MAETKHGGSPALGLVPAGLENLPKLEGSTLLLEAPSVGAGRKDANANAARAREFERRRIALVALPEAIRDWANRRSLGVADSAQLRPALVALQHADELMELTGGHV